MVVADHGKVLLDGSTGTYEELAPTGGPVLAPLPEGGPAQEIAGTPCAESEVDEGRAMADVTALPPALCDARPVRP